MIRVLITGASSGIGLATVRLFLDRGAEVVGLDLKECPALADRERYAFQPQIRSVLFNASASGVSGDEFPEYAASKAGVIGYMRSCAKRLAAEFRATCNATCFGGVRTELNRPVTEDPGLWRRIMAVTPLRRWATADEAAEWIYFLTAVNTFCTGQAIVIDGGEKDCNSTFVWPPLPSFSSGCRSLTNLV